MCVCVYIYNSKREMDQTDAAVRSRHSIQTATISAMKHKKFIGLGNLNDINIFHLSAD